MESTYGEGSQFYFTIKLRKFESNDTKIAEKMAHFQGRRVLYVDSMEQGSDTMEKIRQLGLETLRAESLEHATELADRYANTNEHKPFFDIVVIEKIEQAEKIREIIPLRFTPLVLIAPEKHMLNMESCINWGITAYFNTPLNLADLADALGPALEHYAALPSDTSKTIPLNILLAEDNVVNQKIAIRLLDKIGHKVKVVSNGKLAVEAFESQRFDMILMDVQMPVMGGFEATQRIREIEREMGSQTRIPIIALTAYAMIGDREKCLKSGMVKLTYIGYVCLITD